MTATTLEPIDITSMAIECDMDHCSNPADYIIRAVCGCSPLFCSHHELEMMSYITSHLPLTVTCQNHPGRLGWVEKLSDFIESVQPL